MNTNWNENGTIAEAISQLKGQNFSIAKSICQNLTNINPQDALAWHIFGLADAQQGNLEQAVVSLRTATLLAPINASFHFNLALAYKGLGQIDQAEASYREAIQQNDDFHEAYVNLGTLLVEQHKAGEAKVLLKKRLDRCDAASDVHYNLANLLRDSEDPLEAIHHYSRAIELSPDLVNARENLAKVLVANERTQDARLVLKDWIKDFPNSSMARHMLASVDGENVPERCEDEYIRETFGEDFAEKFDEQLARLHYQAPEFVANALLALCDPCKRLTILDAGCGTGLCAAKIRPIAAILHGVDLSASMLNIADARMLYDHLVEDELTAYLFQHRNEYDCLISADTLCYFGDLQQVAKAARMGLRSKGLLIFTVELQAENTLAPFSLQANGRYCHSEHYVRSSLETTGFHVLSIETVVLRTERGKPVPGVLVVAECIE